MKASQHRVLQSERCKKLESRDNGVASKNEKTLPMLQPKEGGSDDGSSFDVSVYQ